MAAVRLRGVSKTYPGTKRVDSGAKRGVAAVRGIDLEVGDGEFVVLVGPSGCGKTTTLRMVAGLEEVSAGEIRIGERIVNHVSPKDRDIAMVFQNYALYPHMSVYRNMAFGLELRYRSNWWSRFWLALKRPAEAAVLAEKRRGIRLRVEQTAEMLGIGHLLDRRPGQLSGGEKQRVALGRAIVRQPAAFLFDEPLSNLDAQLRGEMRRELRRLHAELHATMLYVTHDQVEAMTLGDRVVVMNQGEVMQVGTPLEVYDCPLNCFVARFLGSPPMNLVPGRIEQTSAGWQFAGEVRVQRIERQLPADALQLGRKVSLGVRPEDVRLLADGVEHDAAGSLAADEAVVTAAAVVESVEPLGDATLVQVRCGPHRDSTVVAAKLRSRVKLSVGSRVAVGVSLNRLHWFDTLTELRLGEVDDGKGKA
jgi:ABC-type sugar transport system ATPase subunit